MHENYIKNYFIKNFKSLFENKSYDYHDIPEEAKTISFLENYKHYLKDKLGLKRISY